MPTMAPDSLLQSTSRFFIIMLALLGVFNFSIYFKFKSKIVLVFSIIYCTYALSIELTDAIVTISTMFLYPNDVSVFYKTQFTFFRIHRLFNVCYVLVLSFHPKGFSKISDSLMKRSQTESKKYNAVLIAMCFMNVSIKLSIMVFVALISDIDEATERHFQSYLNKKDWTLKLYVLIMHFCVMPVAILLFHSLYFTLTATLFCKFRSFNQNIEQAVIKDKILQNVEALTQLENEYEQLTDITKDFQKYFSLYLGVNTMYWMFMACGILYDSLTKHTTGYDTYIVLHILQTMVTLLVCSLVNSEVMQCVWYIMIEGTEI